jgi:hypothetical protein
MRRDAETRLTRVRGAAAAFLGLLALTYGDLSGVLLNNAPHVLRALFVTVSVLCGFTVVRSYVGLQRAATEIARDPTAAPPGRKEREKRRTSIAVDEYYLGRAYYTATLVIGVVTVVLFLTNVWIAAFA